MKNIVVSGLNKFDNSEIYSKINRTEDIAYISEAACIGIKMVKDLFEKYEIDFEDKINREIGIVLGSYYGSQQINEKYLSDIYFDKKRRVKPSLFSVGTANAVGGILGIHYNMGGPNLSLIGLNSGVQSVIVAYNKIKENHMSAAIVGGIDYITEHAVSYLKKLLNKDGVTFYSGGILLMENSEICEREGRKPIAKILDYSIVETCENTLNQKDISRCYNDLISQNQYLLDAQIIVSDIDKKDCCSPAADGIIDMCNIFEGAGSGEKYIFISKDYTGNIFGIGVEKYEHN